MRSPTRNRPAWNWALVAVALGAGAFGALASPGTAPRRGTGALSQGANTELERARHEQALIRGESTAALLRVLEAAPTLPVEEP